MSAPMAIFSDVHGNLPALEAVLKDIAEQGCVEIYCLGDVVGYGARPGECIETLWAPGIVTLRGNHDTAVMEGSTLARGGGILGRMWEWTEQALSADQRKWLAGLPLVLDRPGFQAAHATLHESEQWGYIVDAVSAELHFQHQTEPVCFVGHTHRPMLWRRGETVGETANDLSGLDPAGQHLVNVGSVGQPRDGDARACYVLYQPESREVVWRRVPYQISAAQNAIEDAGLPIQFADRLKGGK